MSINKAAGIEVVRCKYYNQKSKGTYLLKMPTHLNNEPFSILYLHRISHNTGCLHKYITKYSG